MKLQGADGLTRRLVAMQKSTRTIPRRWGDAYIGVARPLIPVRRGVTRRSIRLSSVSDTSAKVSGSQVAAMLDSGTASHTIAKPSGALVFKGRGRTVFTKRVRHPGTRAQKWRTRAAHEANRRAPMKDTVVNAWNRAD